jgi:hypothetical protein
MLAQCIFFYLRPGHFISKELLQQLQKRLIPLEIDNFANKTANIPPLKNLRKFKFREVVRARTKIAHQHFVHPPFKNKD